MLGQLSGGPVNPSNVVQLADCNNGIPLQAIPNPCLSLVKLDLICLKFEVVRLLRTSLKI
jgi:hypothetical protein